MTDPQAFATTDTYASSDLNTAAFLMARGHPLLGVESQARGRCVFRFPLRARDDAPGFMRNDPVPAWDFANALRALKARVREF